MSASRKETKTTTESAKTDLCLPFKIKLSDIKDVLDSYNKSKSRVKKLKSLFFKDKSYSLARTMLGFDHFYTEQVAHHKNQNPNLNFLECICLFFLLSEAEKSDQLAVTNAISPLKKAFGSHFGALQVILLPFLTHKNGYEKNDPQFLSILAALAVQPAEIDRIKLLKNILDEKNYPLRELQN